MLVNGEDFIAIELKANWHEFGAYTRQIGFMSSECYDEFKDEVLNYKPFFTLFVNGDEPCYGEVVIHNNLEDIIPVVALENNDDKFYEMLYDIADGMGEWLYGYHEHIISMFTVEVKKSVKIAGKTYEV